MPLLASRSAQPGYIAVLKADRLSISLKCGTCDRKDSRTWAFRGGEFSCDECWSPATAVTIFVQAFGKLCVISRNSTELALPGGPVRFINFGKYPFALEQVPLPIRNVICFCRLEPLLHMPHDAPGRPPRVVRHSCLAEAAIHDNPCVLYIENDFSMSRGADGQLGELLRSSTLQMALEASLDKGKGNNPMAIPRHGCIHIPDVLVFRCCAGSQLKPFRLHVVIAGTKIDAKGDGNDPRHSRRWRLQCFRALMACTSLGCEVLIVDVLGSHPTLAHATATAHATIFRDLLLGQDDIASYFKEIVIAMPRNDPVAYAFDQRLSS